MIGGEQLRHALPHNGGAIPLVHPFGGRAPAIHHPLGIDRVDGVLAHGPFHRVQPLLVA